MGEEVCFHRESTWRRKTHMRFHQSFTGDVRYPSTSRDAPSVHVLSNSPNLARALVPGKACRDFLLLVFFPKCGPAGCPPGGFRSLGVSLGLLSGESVTHKRYSYCDRRIGRGREGCDTRHCSLFCSVMSGGPADISLLFATGA